MTKRDQISSHHFVGPPQEALAWHLSPPASSLLQAAHPAARG